MLATIVSIEPIPFAFTFDAASLLRYERLAKSLREGSEGDSTTVSLRLLDEKDFVHKGRMDFVDNVIDRSSGTIRGRAQFTNSDALFTPGMFARIRVPGSQPYQAVLIPDAAIGTDQGRKFALVVKDDNTAEAKYLTLGHVVDDTLRVVKDGLSPDDRVIVNGLMRARAGQKVTPKEQGEDAPAKVSGSAQSTTR
jgi:RND family efflux transporter MFP subunit